MKKLLIILLVLVYALPSTGASLYLHFCCGKLDDVSFSVKHKAGCMQKATDSKKCCNNVTVDLKLTTDQEPLAKWLSPLNESVTTLFAYPSWTFSLPAGAALLNHKANGPPLFTSSVPVYIKNCVFRI